MTNTPKTTPEETRGPIKAPTLPYTSNATLKDYRRRLGTWRIILATAITLIILVRFGFAAWLISLVALGLIIGGILMFFAKRRVTMTDAGLEYKNLFKTRTVNYGDLEGAKVFVNYYDPAFGMMARVSISKRPGVEWLTLIGMFWPADELDALAATLKDKGVKVEYYEEAVAYTTIARELPAYATYIERHPGKIVAVSLVAIIIGAAAIAYFMM